MRKVDRPSHVFIDFYIQRGPTELDPIDRACLSVSETVLNKRMMDNVQNCYSYINIPSSQTYR
jgi:hypothetical protein